MKYLILVLFLTGCTTTKEFELAVPPNTLGDYNKPIPNTYVEYCKKFPEEIECVRK